MKFSVCIPNFNYARYIGQTIRSVLAEPVDLEVLVCDNASTDASVEVVEALADPRIRIARNPCNLGFSANLDRVARMATGDFILMLSSDDLVKPGALVAYSRLVDALGSRASRAIVTASADVVDANDTRTGGIAMNEDLWDGAAIEDGLSRLTRHTVRVKSARDLLRASLGVMKNPINFLATLYSRALWEAVGGYGGSRLINPDKWFHYRLLGAAEEAIYVDAPLFAYRWHAQNQTAQQKASGSLKYLADEYATTLELDSALLTRIGLERRDIVASFVEHDIGRHGLATLARGDHVRARRILDFGRACYPQEVRRSSTARLLAGLLSSRALGKGIARFAYRLKGDG